MKFFISASTDRGGKSANQDSVCALQLKTPQGPMAFAILCDGMGGLDHGELASAAVVRAFRQWALNVLPELCKAPLEESLIRRHWDTMIQDLNSRIGLYSQENGTQMGTTAVVMLLTQTWYFIMNVGDSRAYELTDLLCQITRDHSVVAREVEAGRITPEDAEHHPQRNILTRCIGAPRQINGDMFYGRTKKNAVYMLCSDGFRHELTSDELYEHLGPKMLRDPNAMKRNATNLIGLNQKRGETDNISVVLVRTY